MSGFRLTAGVGFFGDAKPGYRKFGLLELDYLWDINAALFGYKEQRLFNASVGVGPVLAYVTGANTGLYPGMGVSLKGEWGFPSGFGLFIEPQMRIFGQKFSTERVASLPVDFLLSMNVGVRYKLDGYDSANNSSEYEQSKKIFVSAAYGGKLLYAGQGNSREVMESLYRWVSGFLLYRLGVLMPILVDLTVFPKTKLLCCQPIICLIFLLMEPVLVTTGFLMPLRWSACRLV